MKETVEELDFRTRYVNNSWFVQGRPAGRDWISIYEIGNVPEKEAQRVFREYIRVYKSNLMTIKIAHNARTVELRRRRIGKQ